MNSMIRVAFTKGVCVGALGMWLVLSVVLWIFAS